MWDSYSFLVDYYEAEATTLPYSFEEANVKNEGRHLSWFLAKEWTRSFGFGKRGKGEENKTFYGWLAAVRVSRPPCLQAGKAGSGHSKCRYSENLCIRRRHPAISGAGTPHRY
jgi:hypothetical protein